LRLDELLGLSGIEADFFRFSMTHRKIDLNQCTALEVESLSRGCVLALRSNLARMITGMTHRDFCSRLADSSLLQWFLQIGRVDGVTAFAKSTSDRFAHCIDANSINKINAKIIRLLQSDSEVDWGSDEALILPRIKICENRMNEAALKVERIGQAVSIIRLR
jgi:hypothetical protein